MKIKAILLGNCLIGVSYAAGPTVVWEGNVMDLDYPSSSCAMQKVKLYDNQDGYKGYDRHEDGTGMIEFDDVDNLGGGCGNEFPSGEVYITQKENDTRMSIYAKGEGEFPYDLNITGYLTKNPTTGSSVLTFHKQHITMNGRTAVEMSGYLVKNVSAVYHIGNAGRVAVPDKEINGDYRSGLINAGVNTKEFPQELIWDGENPARTDFTVKLLHKESGSQIDVPMTGYGDECGYQYQLNDAVGTQCEPNSGYFHIMIGNKSGLPYGSYKGYFELIQRPWNNPDSGGDILAFTVNFKHG